MLNVGRCDQGLLDLVKPKAEAQSFEDFDQLVNPGVGIRQSFHQGIMDVKAENKYPVQSNPENFRLQMEEEEKEAGFVNSRF